MLDASQRGVLRHQISLVSGAFIAAGLQAQKLYPVIAGVFGSIAATVWSVAEARASGDKPMSGSPFTRNSDAQLKAGADANNAAAAQFSNNANQLAATGPTSIAPVGAHPLVQGVVQSVYNDPSVAPMNAASVCANILAAVMPELQPALAISRASPRTSAEVALGISLIANLLAAFFPHPALAPPPPFTAGSAGS